ncbi:MAG: hypothetical protein OEM52_04610 [bacterium]|nr:hypothetical protein [bacterium]
MTRNIAIFLLLAFVGLAIAQPVPVEFLSFKQPDKIQIIKGPNGKTLGDGSLVYVIRMLDGERQVPRAGLGYGAREAIIHKSQINPDRVMPGEISFVLTVAEQDEFWKPFQGIKGEYVFLRVFATKDTLLPKGTPYAETQPYLLPSLPHSFDGVTIGEWKKIP